MNKPVNVYVQMFLCIYPMLVFYPCYRIGKTKEGFVFIIASLVLFIGASMLFGYFDGLVIDAIVIYPFMLFYVHRWSKEWNATLADYQKKLESQKSTPI